MENLEKKYFFRCKVLDLRARLVYHIHMMINNNAKAKTSWQYKTLRRGLSLKSNHLVFESYPNETQRGKTKNATVTLYITNIQDSHHTTKNIIITGNIIRVHYTTANAHREVNLTIYPPESQTETFNRDNWKYKTCDKYPYIKILKPIILYWISTLFHLLSMYLYSHSMMNHRNLMMANWYSVLSHRNLTINEEHLIANHWNSITMHHPTNNKSSELNHRASELNHGTRELNHSSLLFSVSATKECFFASQISCIASQEWFCATRFYDSATSEWVNARSFSYVATPEWPNKTEITSFANQFNQKWFPNDGFQFQRIDNSI